MITRFKLIALVVLTVAGTVISGLGATGSVSSHSRAVADFGVHAAPSVAVLPGSASPLTLAAKNAPAASCPAPHQGYPPHWNGTNFWYDASVTFSLPGQAANSWSSFGTVPCLNMIPTYANGFWVNVSTDQRLFAAYLTIWGTSWAQNGSGNPITGYSPVNQTTIPMTIHGPFREAASFFFNTYAYFWPGSSVGFNMTLVSVNATPSIIRSASTPPYDPETYSFCGCTAVASWIFSVRGPWLSGNFSNDIAVSTTPSALTNPAFEPNARQSLQITLTSLNLSGGAPPPIPNASIALRETVNGTITTIGEYFTPENHSVMSLPYPLPPDPGASVAFNITATLPWLGGLIDPLVSRQFTFSWSPHGGWWFPTLGLVANLNLTAQPSAVLLSGPADQLATGTPVNVTIHEEIQNVTIASARALFRFSDAAGQYTGTVPMIRIDQNTSYVLFPGLPNGGQLTFSLQAKDIFGLPVASSNYTYTEGGTPTLPIPPGDSLLFVEGFDPTTGLLIPFLNVSIANSTWSEHIVGNPFGFAVPVPTAGPGYLYVGPGSYIVKASAFGKTLSTVVTLTAPGTGPYAAPLPTPVVFLIPSGSIPAPTPASLPTYSIAAVVGLYAATVALIPVSGWYEERRAAAEAEQRRITL